MKISVLAQEALRHMGRLDMAFLEEVRFLSGLRAQKSATGARYANAGQGWYARKLGCSVRTVGRIVRRLRLMGVISVWCRRKSQGHWQTNLVSIVRAVAWASMRRVALVKACFNGRTKTADIASIKEESPKKDLPKMKHPAKVDDSDDPWLRFMNASGHLRLNR